MEELKLLKAIEQDARISVTDLADILNSEIISILVCFLIPG